MLPDLPPRRLHHLTPAALSFNLCRLAEILGTIGFTPAGEAVIAGFAGDSGNLVEHSIAAQHAEMPVMIDSAGTLLQVFHFESPFY
jgi:hypothetical protein